MTMTDPDCPDNEEGHCMDYWYQWGCCYCGRICPDEAREDLYDDD